jgi:hypothetical protein
VHSEISRRLRVDNPVQQHVRDHLGDFVAVSPGAAPCVGCAATAAVRAATSYGGSRCMSTPTMARSNAPAACRRRERRAVDMRRPPLPRDRVALAGERELRRIDGFWYEVKLAPLARPNTAPSRRCVSGSTVLA